jgi:small subunit ribosomal protein S3
MGQKVNPISMRLQVNKDWRSKWFVGKRDYAKYLKDDLAVRRLIQNKLVAVVLSTKLTSSVHQTSLLLLSLPLRPVLLSVVVVRCTRAQSCYRKNLRRATRVNIEEVKKPELYAKLVAENIAHQLERRMSFRRAIKSRLPLLCAPVPRVFVSRLPAV